MSWETSEIKGGYADCQTSRTELVILGGQAQLLPPCQIQVGGVVGCQPMLAGKCYRRLPHPECLPPFDLNREPPQRRHERGDTVLGDSFPAFSKCQGVGDLKWPQGWHNRVSRMEGGEHRTAVRGLWAKHQLRVIEASTANGGIGQYLCAWWIRSRMRRSAPKVKPCFSANSSMSFTARRRSSF